MTAPATPITEQISVDVPHDVATALRAQVARGQYATESDAVTEALRSAQEQDRETEAWLRKVIVPICDDVMAGTATLLTIDEVRERLRLSR